MKNSSQQQIPLILSCHQFQLAITLNSSRQHSVSTQSWWMKIFGGQPTLVYPCKGVHLWVCAYFSRSAQHVWVILLGRFMRWEESGCTAALLDGYASRMSSKQYTASLCSSHLVFFFKCFVKVQEVQPYSSTNTTTAWMNFCFILSEIRFSLGR